MGNIYSVDMLHKGMINVLDGIAWGFIILLYFSFECLLYCNLLQLNETEVTSYMGFLLYNQCREPVTRIHVPCPIKAKLEATIAHTKWPQE